MAKRRLPKTLADYLAIAATPILIMLLVGSLIFFLHELFLEGRFESRSRWILFWFVVGSVLIGRIAIESGRAHAGAFTAALSVAVALAIFKFVPDKPLIVIGCLALIWWCTDKLTWDCSFIDDAEDASGEGLLQVAGMSDRAEITEEDNQDPGKNVGSQNTNEVTTPDKDDSKRVPFWKQLFLNTSERSGKPHAPGLWVVYFSLAALPLFGFGQTLIPSADEESRDFAFRTLFVYVGAALGLLLLTSFLGLRRYLRQRQLQMPTAMAATWVGFGTMIAFGILVTCLLLPRPDAEYDLTSLIDHAGDKIDQASSYAMVKGDRGEGDGKRIGDQDNQAPQPGNAQKQKQNQGQPGGQQGNNPQGQPGRQQGQNGKAQGDRKPGQQGGEKQKSGGRQEQGGQQRGTKNQDSRQNGNQASGQQTANQQQAKQQDGAQRHQQSKQQGSDNRSETPNQANLNNNQSEKKNQTNEQKNSGGQPNQKQQSSQRANSKSQQQDNQRNDPTERGNNPDQRQQQHLQENRERQQRQRQQQQDQADGNGGRPLNDPNKENDQREQGQEFDESQAAGSESAAEKMSSVFDSIGKLFKWIMYGILICVALFLLWRNWAAICTFFGRLWSEFLSLFGGRKPVRADETDQAEEPVAPLRPFADFSNPFRNGAANQVSPIELVRYTFNALEAWAYEHNYGRVPSQTPMEFGHRLETRPIRFGAEAKEVSSLYARVAYAGHKPNNENLQLLERLWSKMSA